MEEDAERMDRVDMDGDFEGGRRCERAPQTRDDALYCVFNDSDSDDAAAGNLRRRKKRRRG
uniref:Tuftelin interacting protein N-terminal domain-containing protein n=1 Tax=Oryza punctata TaxID=4537 RepID=A0A0E0MPH0_ORYPU